MLVIHDSFGAFGCFRSLSIKQILFRDVGSMYIVQSSIVNLILHTQRERELSLSLSLFLVRVLVIHYVAVMSTRQISFSIWHSE